MTKEEYDNNPKKCRYCNTPIFSKDTESLSNTLNRQFCSPKCFYSSRKKLKYCKNCGVLLKRSDVTYCSINCQHDLSYKEYIIRWKNGEETGLTPNGKETSNPIRRYLFEKYNSKCARCGWNEINPKSNRIPLQVEHIDGNYKNHKEENLILLCPNCHSLTPTFGNLNKGNGRDWRYSNE